MRIFLVAVAFIGCAQQVGCGTGEVSQRRTIRVDYDPLHMVRSQLERYAGGQAVDSERELFVGWVGEIGRSDPEKAEWLGKGLAEIDAKPAQARSIAKKLLAKLDE